MNDIRYAVRVLASKPSFTLVAVLTLALGLGTGTAVFSLADGMLFRPLPYAEPDRLLQISSYARGQRFSRVARVDYEQLRRHPGLEDVGLVASGPVWTWIGSDGAESIRTVSGTPSLLALLGVGAHIGRPLQPADASVTPRPVMLTFDAWRRRFGQDPSAVGRTIVFAEGPVEIVGVLPRDFLYPGPGFVTGDLLFVQHLNAAQAEDPRAGVLMPVARMRRGTSVAEVQTGIDVLVSRAEQQYPAAGPGRRLVALDLQSGLFERNRLPLLLMLGAAGGVVVLVAVNLASLLAARARDRAREAGIRAAVGASRARLFRQLLVESLLLGALGGAAALVLAVVSHDLLRSAAPSRYSLIPEDLGVRAIAVTLALSVAASLAFGSVPALRLSRLDVQAALGRSAGARRERGLLGGGGLLVALEVALCVILLAGTGLMTNSMVRRLTVDLGFVNRDALLVTVNPPSSRYPDAASRYRYMTSVLEQVRDVPGVVHAGGIDISPVAGGEPMTGLTAGMPPRTGLWTVTPGYFSAIGATLLGGTDFTAAHARDDAPVAIVSESVARYHWPGGGALGRTIDLGLPGHPPLQIVGIVKDGRSGYGGQPRPGIYRVLSQARFQRMDIVAWGAGGGRELAPQVRAAAQRVDPTVVVPRPVTFRQPMETGLTEAKFHTGMFLLFGGVGLLVAAIGVYGVMAQWVAARTREMGVRLALGARPGALQLLVLTRATGPVAVGLVCGLGGAYALSRQLEALLYDVRPGDPATLLGAAAVLATAAVTAALVPARRASRVDPVEVLRS